MSFTASSGQQAAQPVRTTAEGGTTSSPTLINGASASTPVLLTSDEALLMVNPVGTLTSDCSVVILASPNNVNFAIVRTLTNAEIAATVTTGNGWAGVLKIGAGNWVRAQFLAGTTTGAGNGVIFRVRN